MSAWALQLEWGALEEGQCYELSSMIVNPNESGTTIGELKAVVGECPN